MDVPSFSSENSNPGGSPVGDSSQISTEDVGEEFSLANPFLNGMPEEHRRLLAPYVKQWDGQVTKKFQNYSNQLKPYQALGQAEELQRYKMFADNFRMNPEGLFKLMWETFAEQHGDNFQTELQRILGFEDMSDFQEYQDYQEPVGQNGQDGQAGLGSDISQHPMFMNLVNELQELRQWRQQMEQSQVDSQEQAQLDSVLEQMHNQFGNFDDGFILLELSKHGDVQKAMEAWNSMLGQYGSPKTPQRQAPKIMGGQGGVPSGQVKTDELRGQDRRQAVANMLASLDQG